MGAIHKLEKNIGEIKRMYIRPEYRGRKLSRKILNQLLETGDKMGCVSYILDTPKFAYAAQHLYKTAGFTEIEHYTESEIPPLLQPFWMYMEKKE